MPIDISKSDQGEGQKLPDKKVEPEVAPEKTPALAFKDSNFGKLVVGAVEAKKNPAALRSRILAKKPKPVGSAPDKQDLRDNADKLAEGTKKIEVTKGADGRETVKIDLDLSRVKDVSAFGPDVKSFNIKLGFGSEKDGDRKVEERSVFRDRVDGIIGYFYKDSLGRKVKLEFPKGLNDAEITIKPEQYDNKTEDQVLAMMKAEMLEAQKQLQEKAAAESARKSVGGSVGDELTGVVGGSGVRNGGAPSIESNPSPIAPLPSPPDPLSSSGFPKSINSSAEPVSGSVDGLTKTIEAVNSPTGKKILENVSSNPELAKRKPYFILALHGDSNSADRFIKEVLPEADRLRRDGINAIVIALEYAPGTGKDAMATSWNFLDGKVDALFDYLLKKYGEGKMNLVSFSGGYRAVQKILADSKRFNLIDSVEFLDSSYGNRNLVKNVVEYVRSGGKVLALNATSGPRAGAEKIKAALNGNFGSGLFKSLPKASGHASAPLMREALAFAAGVERTKTPVPVEVASGPDVDSFLTRFFCELAPSAPKRNARKGHCDMYATDFVNFVLSRLALSRSGKGVYISKTPTVVSGLEGKSLASFTPDDCRRLKPGQAIRANSPYKGNQHWLVYLGFDSSNQPIFSDNHQTTYSLDYFKAHYGKKGRVVINVHDPLAEYRNRMAVVDGRLLLDERVLV